MKITCSQMKSDIKNTLQPLAQFPFGLFIHQNKWTAAPHTRLAPSSQYCHPKLDLPVAGQQVRLST